MSPSRRVQKGGRTASPPGNMTNTSSSTACGRRRRSSPRASAAPREVDRDPLLRRRLEHDRHQPAGHHISHHDHDHVAVLPARYGAEHSSTLVPSGIGRTSAETRSSAFVATSASATAIPGAVSSSVAWPSGKAMTASSRPFSVMPSPRCVIGGIRLHAGGQNHRTLAPGPVREDYSASGYAWQYFSHDQARSRAYRWGEDGLGGISDDRQLLCFALALWNGQDPILKERLFGLTNSEGNHGEDVKEYYFYLDSTPTHSPISTTRRGPTSSRWPSRWTLRSSNPSTWPSRAS